MTTSTSALDDLRRRIDQIDDQLHDLIMQRAEVEKSRNGENERGAHHSEQRGNAKHPGWTEHEQVAQMPCQVDGR